MKIIVCAKNDLLGNIAVNHLMAGWPGRDLMLCLSDKTRPLELEDPYLKQLKALERDLPNAILFPLLEAADPGRSGRYLTFRELAAQVSGGLHVIPTLKDKTTETLFREFMPDLILSVRFSHIFPESYLTIPRHGIINIHPGILPHYGGLFAVFRQMLNGESEIGCTVHYIDRGIDTGPILAVRKLPVNRERSMLWHLAQLYPLGMEFVLDAIAGLKQNGTLATEPQNPHERHYYPLPSVEEFARFHAAGFKLADFAEYCGLLQGYLPRSLKST